MARGQCSMLSPSTGTAAQRHRAAEGSQPAPGLQGHPSTAGVCTKPGQFPETTRLYGVLLNLCPDR